MPLPAATAARLRLAGLPAARTTALGAAYDAMPWWEQSQLRRVIASRPDEVLRRTYGDGTTDTVDVVADLAAAHDTDPERETFVPARLSAAALRAAFGGPFATDATRLRAFRAALGARATTPVDVLCFGDSVTEGRGATSTDKRYASLVRDGLRARYQPAGIVGGEGYVPAFYVVSDRSDRFAPSGTPQYREDLYGLGVRCVQLSAGSTTATLTFTGTGCDVLYAETVSGPSAFTWAVDGGSATAVTSGSKAANKGGVAVAIRGLAAGSHTVVLTRTSGNVYIEGAMVYNGDEAAGIRLWESGHSGWRAADYNSKSLWWDSVSRVEPDVIVMCLGLNDYGDSTQANRVTPDAYRTALAANLASLRAKTTVPPSIVLVIPYQRQGITGTPVAAWAEYRQAALDLAQADGAITVLDLGTVIGTATPDPYALTIGDGSHPSDKGHQVIADAVVDLLTRAAA